MHARNADQPVAELRVLLRARGIVPDESDDVPVTAAFLQIGAGIGSHFPESVSRGPKLCPDGEI